MFTKMILIMFIALCWFNNIYSNYVKSVKSVNSIDKIKDRLYMCNTYCFTYAENKISLDNYLCNNIYASSCHDLGWNSGKFIINNVSCNYLYAMSFGAEKYKYTNPPYLEKFCNATNINCNVHCNPYELHCTIDEGVSPSTPSSKSWD